MAMTYKRLAGPLTATTSTTSIYTVPQDTTTVIKEFMLTNYSASAATITVYVKEANVTLGDAHIIISDLSLSADETFSMSASLVLHNDGGVASDTTSDQIHVVASVGSAINIVMNGIEDA